MIFIYITNFIMFVIGAWIGIKFADIDQAAPLRLGHRSVWTHGPLVALIIVYLLSAYPNIYWLVVGFLPANAIHLLADMFPRNWTGGATIKLNPIKRQLSPALSFLWLAIGVYVSITQWINIAGFLLSPLINLGSVIR